MAILNYKISAGGPRRVSCGSAFVTDVQGPRGEKEERGGGIKEWGRGKERGQVGFLQVLV